MASEKINHWHGDIVRKQWPIDLIIKFRPKGLTGGEDLKGIVAGHLYKNVLVIITLTGNEWHVSTQRCIHPTIKNS